MTPRPLHTPFILFLAVLALSDFARAAPKKWPQCGSLFAEVYLASLETKEITATAFDPAKLDEWVNAHPDETRPFANLVKEKIRYIGFKEYTASFDAMAKRFLKTLSKNDKAIFVYSHGEADEESEHYKSGPWLIGYLHAKFPQLASIPVINEAEISMLRAALHSGVNRVMMVDDHAISGSQISWSLKRVINHELNNFPKNHPQVDILIPYVSDRAKGKVATRQAASRATFPIVWHGHQTLELIEAYAEDSRLENNGVFGDDYESRSDLGGGEDQWSEYQTLTIWEHSRLDFLSFPEFLQKGEVLDRDGKLVKEIPFLKINQPVYRRYSNERPAK